jgi:hypothetical protein
MLSKRLTLLLCCTLALAVAGAVIVRAAGSLRIVPIVHSNELVVSFELSEGYTEEVREAISSGLRTTFTYDVELRMSVAGWVDRIVTAAVITASDQYDNLTRRHTLSRSVDGRVLDALVTDDESVVREWLTTAKRVPLCQTSSLDPSRDYFVRIRARRRPSGASLFGFVNNVTAQARFTFIP